jgi:hypothetical protein
MEIILTFSDIYFFSRYVQNILVYCVSHHLKALGDYCGGVPPLPIPNREVKTASADGTARMCGRVGRRHLLPQNSIPF